MRILLVIRVQLLFQRSITDVVTVLIYLTGTYLPTRLCLEHLIYTLPRPVLPTFVVPFIHTFDIVPLAVYSRLLLTLTLPP